MIVFRFYNFSLLINCISRRKAKSTLLDQRDLIQTLLEERRASDDKCKYLSKSLLSVGTTYHEEDKFNHESSRSARSEQQLASLPRELKEYYNLIRKLLCDIDACQYSLEQSRHLRIRNGIVNVHSAEAVLFRDTYGYAAKQLFDDSFFKFKDAWFPPTDSPFSTSNSRVPEMTGVGNESWLHSFSEPDSKEQSKAELSGRYEVRERDFHYDDRRPVSIKRYIIPSEDCVDQELVIRRKTEREERISRYKREYLTPYSHRRFSRSMEISEKTDRRPASVVIREQLIIVKPARESEDDVVRRSDAEEELYYRRGVCGYDDGRSRRERSPDDSIAQAGRHRSDSDDDDDSMIYIHKETATTMAIIPTISAILLNLPWQALARLN